MDYVVFKASIFPLEIGREILVAELSEVGFESFVETENGVEAYIQKPLYKETLIKEINLLDNADFKIDYTTATIANQNWNETWEKNFELINVENKCVVRAPFHQRISDIEFDIVITPKMSFGTGHHETTYLMIKRLLTLNLEGKSVMDMGCGTGVLAILAQLKNAKHVEAIDIDEWAYNNTLENISANNCNEIVVELGGVEKMSFSTFDVFMANINRNILIEDMTQYNSVLKSGSSLLLSGFYSSDVSILLEKASSLGLELSYKESKNDWTMLHLIKK